MKDLNKLNKEIARFWNEAISLPADYKDKAKEIVVHGHHALAPCEKLFVAVAELGRCDRVLDFGCGSGWASIIAAKEGCPHVDALDVGENPAHVTRYYSELFEVENAVFTRPIAGGYLSLLPPKTYDGLICSNVLDVVPQETAEGIIAEFARLVKDDANVIVSLNYYLSPEDAKRRGIDLVDGEYLFQDGVLRLHSLSDEAWMKLFAPYFEVAHLNYFAWPGEQRETRRLFHLKKKVG